jgi:hypothetical protein
MADVRRASDTRPLPSEPGAAAPAISGRERIDRMMEAASAAAVGYTSPKYGPKIGPTGPPLNAVQADQLLKASGFPEKELSKYKPIIIKAIVEHSQRLPAERRRIFTTLLKLAAHPCAKEPLQQDTYSKLKERIERVDPTEKDPIIPYEVAIKNIVNSFVYVLVEGFDFVSPTHFVFDKDGNVISTTDAEKPRYSRTCVPYLERQKLSTWRPSASELGYDGGKKTRKQKKRSKKTLRRRKVRRNVH